MKISITHPKNLASTENCLLVCEGEAIATLHQSLSNEAKERASKNARLLAASPELFQFVYNTIQAWKEGKTLAHFEYLEGMKLIENIG